jgi:hypothetical protein
MATIFGALGLNDNDRVFNATAGQRAIYDLSAQYVARYNADMEAAIGIFVDGTTTDHKLRYKLPGGGLLQRRGTQSVPGAVKASGSWDVAFPLEDFGAQVAGDDVSLAYMTAQELQRHLDTVVNQDRNTVRYEILKAIFNSTAGTFVDPLWGSLTIERLANGDSVVYPPVLGSTSEATDNHYLESGYAASAISDTNDPVITLVDELEEHFGSVTGNSDIVIFHNNAQNAKLQALTGFIDVPDAMIRVGDATDVPAMLPSVPGKVIGRHTKGAWLVEWRFIPANYMVAVHAEEAKPLLMRVDPADTGLGTGLQLVANDADFPFVSSFWRHRFGVGVGNRLNGAVMELGTGGTYSVPSGY